RSQYEIPPLLEFLGQSHRYQHGAARLESFQGAALDLVDFRVAAAKIADHSEPGAAKGTRAENGSRVERREVAAAGRRLPQSGRVPGVRPGHGIEDDG